MRISQMQGHPPEHPPRVGIVTIQDDANFGNRLQNFALQEVLRRLGCNPQSIRNTPQRLALPLVGSRAWHAVAKEGLLRVAKRNALVLGERFSNGGQKAPADYHERRRDSIAEFSRTRIESSEEDFLDLPPRDWAERYKAAIVGSDQVWNPGFRNAHAIDFLRFVPRGRRIAYAASFGVHDIPKFLEARYKKWVEDIPSVSVREDRGAEIVYNLTGRQVPVVLDPTLLLTVKDWQELIPSAPPAQPGSYAVQFFLGRAMEEQSTWVQQKAVSADLKLLDLNHVDFHEYASLDPAGFVAAIAGAEFVATDSFHVGVFSLLNHKSVVVRLRDETDSRLETLFRKHAIEREATGVDGLTIAEAPDWGRADALLSEERRKSLDFLNQALQRATIEQE